MATPLEDYLKMSTQERQNVGQVQREMSTPYQVLQKPQFVQNVRNALPASNGFYEPSQIEAAIASVRPQTSGQSRVDPRYQMLRDGMLPNTPYVGSPEAQRAGLGLATSRQTPRSPGDMAIEDLIAANAAAEGDTTSNVGGGGGGGGGPRRESIYDMQKGGLDRLLASQKEGFGQQRDLMEQLADLREQGMASQEQFAKDTASARETFLGEQDTARKEQEQQRAVERETQKSTELARQRSQLDEALRATGVDTNAATARLESLGIDPGQFADRETNETTAMLYSQSMSSANFVNQMDAISQSAAQFASDANDQATARAMFGIGQDLAASLQTINQARNQGLIDDAMALQAIADQERAAEQQYDANLTSLNVQTAQAAQAAAAAAARRAEAEAAAQRKLQVGAAALGALQGYQLGDAIDADALYAITEAGLGDAFLDITSGAVDQDQALEIIAANLDADLARDQFGASLSSPSGGMVLPGGMELGDFLDVYSKAGPEQQADLAPYIEQILMAQVGATG